MPTLDQSASLTSQFPIERSSGTHLEFLDANSSTELEAICQIIAKLPVNVVGNERCRRTVWDDVDLTELPPGEASCSIDAIALAN